MSRLKHQKFLNLAEALRRELTEALGEEVWAKAEINAIRYTLSQSRI